MGFWSDLFNSTAFEYRKVTYFTDEKPKKIKKIEGEKQHIKLIRNGKTMVVDVDDYELLDKDDIKMIERRR